MTRPQFQIRGELRLKNARLVAMREGLNMKQKEFALFVGIQPSSYNGYETLRMYPSAKDAAMLASLCCCSLQTLFPEELREFAKSKNKRILVSIANIEPSRLFGITKRQVLALPAARTPETNLALKLARQELDNALDKINPRDAEVLRWYFGLANGRSYGSEEIAKKLGVRGSMIRMRIQRGLKRLRSQEHLREVHCEIRANPHD